MAYGQFKPTIWAKSLNNALRNTMVARSLVNTDYQGDALKGNIVKIIRPSGITVRDYDGTEMILDEGAASSLELTIEKAKYINFYVDDLDAIQTDQDLTKIFLDQANYAIQDVVDKDIFAYMASQADASNILRDGVVATKSNILESFGSAMTCMNKNNIPLIGRFAVISPIEYQFAVEAKCVQPSTLTQDQILATGSLGNIYGFEILISNNLYEESASDVGSGEAYHRYNMFGHRMSTTFASQVNKVEAYRVEKLFADAVKGLTNYGYKTIEPLALGIIKNKLGVAA